MSNQRKISHTKTDEIMKVMVLSNLEMFAEYLETLYYMSNNFKEEFTLSQGDVIEDKSYELLHSNVFAHKSNGVFNLVLHQDKFFVVHSVIPTLSLVSSVLEFERTGGFGPTPRSGELWDTLRYLSNDKDRFRRVDYSVVCNIVGLDLSQVVDSDDPEIYDDQVFKMLEAMSGKLATKPRQAQLWNTRSHEQPYLSCLELFSCFREYPDLEMVGDWLQHKNKLAYLSNHYDAILK